MFHPSNAGNRPTRVRARLLTSIHFRDPFRGRGCSGSARQGRRVAWKGMATHYCRSALATVSGNTRRGHWSSTRRARCHLHGAIHGSGPSAGDEIPGPPTFRSGSLVHPSRRDLSRNAGRHPRRSGWRICRNHSAWAADGAYGDGHRRASRFGSDPSRLCAAGHESRVRLEPERPLQGLILWRSGAARQPLPNKRLKLTSATT